jgi:hypothetical protein
VKLGITGLTTKLGRYNHEFFGAHKIVHDFADVVGNGCEYEYDFFLSIDKLPFKFNKDMIVSAFQIFIYHMLFFNTRTPEEFKQYQVLYQANIGRFLPRSKILKIREYYKIANQGNPFYESKARELYVQFMKEHSYGIEPYRIDDIFGNNFKEMRSYRQELRNEVNKKTGDERGNAYYQAIDNYATKAYKIANIDWKEEYFYYFQEFKTLRSILNVQEYEKYYQPYKDYILSNR